MTNDKLFNHQPSTINHLSIFCDGGARGNPGHAGIGFLIKDNKGKVLVEKGKYIGKATNNTAEYQGVIHALKWLSSHQSLIINHQSLIINFYLDSLLVVNQLNGIFKIKNSNLCSLAIQVKNLEKEIKGKFFYYHIPREKNKEADALLNKALNKYLLKP